MTAAPATVFVVDDDDAVRESTAFLLRAAGFAVETHATTAGFLDAALGRPGCAVLDLRMPEVDGLEVARRLARGHVAPVLILVSGDMDLPASAPGIFAVLPKPIDDDQLIDSVRRALATEAKPV